MKWGELYPQELQHVYDSPGALGALARAPSEELQRLAAGHIEAHRIATDTLARMLGQIIIRWGNLEHELLHSIDQLRAHHQPLNSTEGRWIPPELASRKVRAEFNEKMMFWKELVEYALEKLPDLCPEVESVRDITVRHYGVRNSFAHGPIMLNIDYNEPPGIICFNTRHIPNSLGVKTKHGERLITLDQLMEHYFFIADLDAAIAKLNVVALDWLSIACGQSYPQGWPTSVLPHREPYRRRSRARR